MNVRIARILVLCFLLAVLGVTIWFLFFEAHGKILLHHPKQLGADVHAWVDRHYLIAPMICIAAYTMLAVAAAPVWPVQVLAGYGFGLVLGIFWCELSAAISATLTVLVSRFLAADWFHKRVESKLTKLRELDEKLGHNGLLVVIAVRLAHFLPFGLANYALGLTRVTAMDTFVGTLIGAFPSIAAYVTLGWRPKLLTNWKFLTALSVVNILMLSPVILRYLRPQWFKKIGIE